MIKENKVPNSSVNRKRNSKKRYYTYKQAPKKSSLRPPVEREKVKISFLGGMNEIGKNMTLNTKTICLLLTAVLLFRRRSYRV